MIDLERIGRDPTYFKSCCAAFYASPWARFVFGPSLHPGGLPLTEELGARMALPPDARVLDLAAGPGLSARGLTTTFQWNIVGIDYSIASMMEAAGHHDGGSFLVADAERLPFREGAFDGVVSECAFCLLPDKDLAASEIVRVLRRGGVFGLADITLDSDAPLSADLRSALAAISCVAKAEPAWRYREILSRHGLSTRATIDAGFAVRDLVDSLRRKFDAAQLYLTPFDVNVGGFTPERVRDLLDEVRDLVDAGKLSYAIILAEKTRPWRVSVDGPPYHRLSGLPLDWFL